MARNKLNKYSVEEQIVLEYLLYGGYANTLKSAEYIMENMSEEWFLEVLDEGSLADMFSQENDRLASQSKKSSDDAQKRIAALQNMLAARGYSSPTQSSSSENNKPMTTQQRIRRIKDTLDKADEVIKRQESENH